jgi:hypothetical protein
MQLSITLQEGITHAYLTLKNVAASVDVQVGEECRQARCPSELPPHSLPTLNTS